MARARPADPARVRPVALSELHLDTRNPRFGSRLGPSVSETAILDAIVEKFGVDDVLSSLAVNGFFEAEPLVGIEEKGTIRVVEGNRRLAACLILVDDDRAKNQKPRGSAARELQKKHKQPAIDKVPVSLFKATEWKEELLPYLGVRHIAASQPWDSYAKAVWVAQVLASKELTLDDVIQMIGDQHRTTPRMLEGFYFITQLISEARFKPSDSLRKGRGSNPDYPFSWIYTALGFTPVREWLALGDMTEGKRDKPVAKSKLDDAEEFVTYLFGNKTKKRQPAIDDSRDIAELAKAISDPAKRLHLKRGKSLAEVSELARPVEERVLGSITDAQESLGSALVTITEHKLKAAQAKELLEPATRVNALAQSVRREVARAFAGEEGDEE